MSNKTALWTCVIIAFVFVLLGWFINLKYVLKTPQSSSESAGKIIDDFLEKSGKFYEAAKNQYQQTKTVQTQPKDNTKQQILDDITNKLNKLQEE